MSDPSNPLHAELLTGVDLCTDYMVFDNTRPPFDDVKVRQAFSESFDRQLFINLVYNGNALPAVGLYPPGLPGRREGLQGLPFDPAGAQALLAEFEIRRRGLPRSGDLRRGVRNLRQPGSGGDGGDVEKIFGRDRAGGKPAAGKILRRAGRRAGRANVVRRLVRGLPRPGEFRRYPLPHQFGPSTKAAIQTPRWIPSSKRPAPKRILPSGSRCTSRRKISSSRMRRSFSPSTRCPTRWSNRTFKDTSARRSTSRSSGISRSMRRSCRNPLRVVGGWRMIY